MPSFTRQITAAEAVQSVMTTIGLVAPSTIAGGNDRTALQMFALASDVGQKLVPKAEWQFLVADMTLVTTIGVRTYPVPADFDEFIPDSQWNRTTRLPAIGSLSQDEWQMLKARQLTGTTFTMLFRYVDDVIELYDTPTSVQTLVLPYQSRGWCKSAANVPQDNLRLDSDIILFDPQLFKAALKLAWYQSKEFDTSSVQQDYDMCLMAAKAKSNVGRTLSLSQTAEYPYLGMINISDTGYGS